MSPDLVIPIITSLGWLALVGASLASHRLKWNQMLRLALAWLAIFAGLYVMAAWFMAAQGSAGAVI